MEYDKVLLGVGQFGRYQKFIYLFGCLFYIGASFDNMGYIFLSVLPEHWCEVPGTGDLKLTENQRKDLLFPKEFVDWKTTYSKIYNVSIANLCYQHMPRPSSEHSPIMNHAPCRQSALVSTSAVTAPYHANMDYDKFLEFVGQFGRYQKFIYFFGCLFHIGACFDNMSYVFLSLLPKYWCEIPGTGDLNLTENQRKDLSFPVQAVDGKTAHSSCAMYNRNYTGLTREDALELLATNSTPEVIPCQYGWKYDDSQYESSIVTEWDLVCERRYLPATTQSVYMAGMMVGVMASGILSDKFGRWKTVAGCAAMNIVASIMTSFSVSVTMFSALRFFVAFAGVSTKTVFFVLAIELVGPAYRKDVGIIRDFFWVAGYLLIVGVAYALPNWRHMQLALSIPLLIYIPIVWVTPESPRWLYSKGLRARADAIMQKIARHNGKSMPEDVKVVVAGKGKQAFVWDICRYPKLRARTILLYYIWFVTSLGYYGLSLNSPNLGVSVYVSFAISGGIELPSYIFVFLTLNRIGRRPIIAGLFFLGAVALLLTMAVPEDKKWALLLLVTIGKFGISAAYSALYVYTAELFPTVVRNSGVGSASFFGRWGGIVAPQMALLNVFSKYIPLIVFGATTLAAGLITLFILPETKNARLPETMEDCENADKVKCAEEDGDGVLKKLNISEPGPSGDSIEAATA